MKTIFLIAILAFVSCKKKEASPTPDPEPTTTGSTTGNPTPTCSTGKNYLTGKYLFYFENPQGTDTITIKFENNRCPLKDSNRYRVIGASKAVNAYAKPGNTFQAKDYFVETEYENINDGFWGYGTDINVQFTGGGSPMFYISSPNLIKDLRLYPL